MRKEWKKPILTQLSLSGTNEQETCPENNAKCLCEYYHARLFGGCGGCSAPDFKCIYTGRKPVFTKQCKGTSEPKVS